MGNIEHLKNKREILVMTLEGNNKSLLNIKNQQKVIEKYSVDIQNEIAELDKIIEEN